MSAPTTERLRAAIADLSRHDDQPSARLAIAEAQFRLAIDPGTAPAEAIGLLRTAAMYDPFQPKLFLHLGRLLHKAGRHFAALLEYRRAVRLAPTSRRVHLLLALSLLELGKPEQELAQAMIKALTSGSTDALAAIVADLDALLDRHGSARAPRKRPSRPSSQDADATDLWRFALVEQLSRPKPVRAQVAAYLNTGSAQTKNADGFSEYATACVLMLVNGESPAKVRALAGSADSPDPQHPANRLLDAAITLAEIQDPSAFVSTAVEYLATRALPVEFVCWTHFTKYGADGSLPVVDALRLLNGYPDDIRGLECFQELELAVLDGYARKAWAEERFTEARLLWRETIALDPYRVPVAINLALLAARTKSIEEYGPAWARLAELLYLHAAGAGDVQLMLEDRKTLHRALSQNSQQKYCMLTSSHTTARDEEIGAWLADTDALEAWLQEWDRYYLNARLGFRSPTHLLGVPQEVTREALAAARDRFVEHVDTAFRTLNWAGINVFCDLAVASANDAYQQRSRGRDEYYELEKAQADVLTDEISRRGVLLRRMLHALAEDKTECRLELGYTIARHQFSLPWHVLQPLFVERNLIDPETDLVRIAEASLIYLAAQWKHPTPTNDLEWSRRLEALDKCIELLPHRLPLRVFRCRLLYDSGNPDDAYAEALEVLKLPVLEDDIDSRDALVELLGLIGYTAIPETLRAPSDMAGLEETAVAAREALERFPHSGTLRMHLATVLASLGGDERIAEANGLLQEGAESALTDEQRARFEATLTWTGEAADRDVARRQIRQLVIPAMDRASKAVEKFNLIRNSETARQSLDIVRKALDDVATALTIAEQAGLPNEVTRLENHLDQLGELEGELQHRRV
jgi:tetratricopeptide (TPR) repeat protein